MKKYLLTIGLVAFLMTSCCNKQEEKGNCEKSCANDKKEQCDKHHHEMCPEMMGCMDALVNALANWNDLDEAQRNDAIEMAQKMVEMKANMPKHEGCKEHKGECKHHEGECKEHKGECKHHEGECKEHKGECKHHEGGCKHEEGNKCEGDHEGCQHQHEGCQHETK